MKRVFLMAILVVACGCKHNEYTGFDGSATLSFSPSFSADKADSRATATSFEDGDRVGVYVVKQGQTLRAEFNAADNHLFRYFAVGDSLGSVPMAMYYPDKSTPVAIYAYYPYINGGERFSALAMPFNVAKNQRAGVTTSDLCLSRSGFAAPSASPRSLTFYHALSQVVVNVDYSAVADVDSLYSVRFLGVRSEVLVNLADGALTLQDAPSFVITNSVAILPPQTFAVGKLIEIQMRMNSGELATYYFNPLTEITIEAKKCNTLSLKLRNDYRAELTSALAISPWIGGAGNGQLTDKVSNDFTLTYLSPNQGFTNVNRVVLTIAGKEYEATNTEVKNNGDGSANIAFSLKNNAPKEYPYTITALKLYTGSELFLDVTKDNGLISSEVYKTGEKMLACGAFIPPIVIIAGTKWCSTNLTGTPRQGAKVELCEKPEDYGMYFKWGCSQVYAHGTSTSDGSWGSVTAGAATSPASSNSGSLGYDYTQGLSGGTSPGDPCKKLGANYRTPTNQQFIDLYASRGNQFAKPLQQLNGVNGMFYGPNAQTISGNQSSVPANMIFIPAAGCRGWDGSQNGSEGFCGGYWSSSAHNAMNGHLCLVIYFVAGSVNPNYNWNRGNGFSVRCVQE